MNASISTAAASRRGRAVRLAGIAAASALALPALWFIARQALPYFNVSMEQYGPYFWPRRWGLVLHVAGGSVALLTGLVQLWLGLTGRVARWHRLLGKVYVGAIIVASTAGFYLSLTIPENLPYAAGLFFLCVAWVITNSMAVLAIRRRNLRQHREWMMRSYAVTFAFVTFRLGMDVLVDGLAVAFAEAQVLMAWSCWTIPLLVLEPLLQYRDVTHGPAKSALRA